MDAETNPTFLRWALAPRRIRGGMLMEPVCMTSAEADDMFWGYERKLETEILYAMATHQAA